jgi:hypothetical protein
VLFTPYIGCPEPNRHKRRKKQAKYFALIFTRLAPPLAQWIAAAYRDPAQPNVDFAQVQQ